MMIQKGIACAAGASALACGVWAPSAFAVVVSKDASESGAIHASGDNGAADYYASGNDDAFGEYGIATFNFSAADFGGALAGASDVTLSLTHNDRSFTDGDSVLFFYSPDDFNSSYSGLTFDTAANPVNGLDTSDFSSIFALGSYSYTPKAGGAVDGFTLNFSGAALTSLISQINAGSAFQIIIAAESASDDVTFSGVGNTFDPGDPALAINGVVPEPASLMLLAAGGSLIALRRRA